MAAVSAVGVAVIVMNSAGNARVGREGSKLQAAIPAALAQVTGVELLLGASDDTWAQVGDDIGASPLFSTGTSSIDLRFDITPAIAPWLSRCFVATVDEITDDPIPREAISFETVNESC